MLCYNSLPKYNQVENDDWTIKKNLMLNSPEHASNYARQQNKEQWRCTQLESSTTAKLTMETNCFYIPND